MDIDLKVPAGWHELTPEQVVYVAKLYNLKLERAEFLSFAFIKFSGIKVFHVLNIPFFKYFRFTKFALWLERTLFKYNMQIEDTEDFWFSYNGQKFSLNTEAFRFFCEKLNFLTDKIHIMNPPKKLKGFHGPGSMAMDITLEEYLTADIYYLNVSRNESLKMEMICKMIAVLWRKKGETYYDGIVEKRYKKFLKLNPAVLTAVYQWWTGLKIWLKEQYPLALTPGTGENSSQAEMIFGLLNVFNGGKPQDNESLYKTKAHNILWELNKKIENSKKN